MGLNHLMSIDQISSCDDSPSFLLLDAKRDTICPICGGISFSGNRRIANSFITSKYCTADPAIGNIFDPATNACSAKYIENSRNKVTWQNWPSLSSFQGGRCFDAQKKSKWVLADCRFFSVHFDEPVDAIGAYSTGSLILWTEF